MNVADKKALRDLLLEIGYRKTHAAQLMRFLMMEIRERGFRIEKKPQEKRHLALRDVHTGKPVDVDEVFSTGTIRKKEKLNSVEKRLVAKKEVKMPEKKKRGRPRKVA